MYEKTAKEYRLRAPLYPAVCIPFTPFSLPIIEDQKRFF
jgi:hypothetical protein